MELQKLSFAKLLEEDVSNGDILIQVRKGANAGMTITFIKNVNALTQARHEHVAAPPIILRGNTGAELKADLDNECPELSTFFEE